MVQTFYISNLDYLIQHNSSLKYQRSITLGCKDIWIRKLEFVASGEIILKGVFAKNERGYKSTFDRY